MIAFLLRPLAVLSSVIKFYSLFALSALADAHPVQTFVVPEETARCALRVLGGQDECAVARTRADARLFVVLLYIQALARRNAHPVLIELTKIFAGGHALSPVQLLAAGALV